MPLPDKQDIMYTLMSYGFKYDGELEGCQHFRKEGRQLGFHIKLISPDTVIIGSYLIRDPSLFKSPVREENIDAIPLCMVYKVNPLDSLPNLLGIIRETTEGIEGVERILEDVEE
ncbi:MAG: hypothetical protein V1743_01465 [Nanoarchaeota archaeon]